MFVKSNGFTLIEVLIAIGILLVIITLIGMIFRGALLSWSESQILARSYQTLKRIFLGISKEVSSSVKIDETLAVEDVAVFKADSQSIFFIYPDRRGLKEIGYIYDAQNKILLRRQSECDFDFDSFDQEEEVGANIESLSFSFFDGSSWQESTESLPQAVKVKLTLSYKRFTATYEETINIPVSQ
jgi:prepilin-type N-terminal cleavage/methylation domain-containing protein